MDCTTARVESAKFFCHGPRCGLTLPHSISEGGEAPIRIPTILGLVPSPETRLGNAVNLHFDSCFLSPIRCRNRVPKLNTYLYLVNVSDTLGTKQRSINYAEESEAALCCAKTSYVRKSTIIIYRRERQLK